MPFVVLAVLDVGGEKEVDMRELGGWRWTNY